MLLKTGFGMIISGLMAEYIGTSNLFLVCVASSVAILTLSWLFTDVRYVEEMRLSPNDEPKEPIDTKA